MGNRYDAMGRTEPHQEKARLGMSDGLVSVVIPTFNRARTLPRAVESALGQSHPHVEIVVADDGSSDGTGELVRERWGREPRVRYLYQDNAGVSAARNLALGQASGDFVAFLDSDDSWVPWKLELQLACFRAFPEAGMCWTDMEARHPDGRLIERRYLRRMYSAWGAFRAEQLFARSAPLAQVAPGIVSARGEMAYAGDIYAAMLTGSLVHTSTTLLTRERLDEVGQFDESLEVAGEDYDFHLRTCGLGPVIFADIPTTFYQWGAPDQLTRPEYGLHRARNFLRTVERAFERDAHRPSIPGREVSRIRGEAHSWVASEALDLGDHRAARAHYVSALRLGQWRAGNVLRLLLATLTPTLAARLREGYRNVKRGLRGA
jgi:GT2 family glycosyltransferase